MSAGHLFRSALVPALGLFISLGATGFASAQSGPVPGWLPWLGCWQAVATDSSAAPSATALCIVPTANSGEVERLTIEEGVILQRERIDATGAARPFNREGCTGDESMTRSESGQRVFHQSDYDCGGLQRRTTAILAFLPGGDWLSIQGVTAGEATEVRVLRYPAGADPAAVNAEVAQALTGRALAVETARTAAGAQLTRADVIEALRHVEAPVVEAWLVEQGQGFAVDASALVELADAGVPARVIDLMVALSYPNVFAIDRSAREAEARPEERTAMAPRRPRTIGMMDPWYDPYYGGSYYPGYGSGWYGPPVIMVRDPDSDDGPRGRAVNGRGYTRDDDGAGRSSTSPSGPDGSRQPSSGGSNSGADTDSEPRRQAKPRS